MMNESENKCIEIFRLKIYHNFCLESGCFVYNKHYNGNDISHSESIESAEKCQLLCQQESRCVWFVYITNDHADIEHRKKCYLKYNIAPEMWDLPGAIGGPAHCGSTSKKPSTGNMVTVFFI